MQITAKTAALVVATVLVTAGAVMAATAVSDQVSVDTFPCWNSRHWTTIRTNEVPLQWDWQTNAVSAELTIVGMNGSVSQSFASGTTSWDWQVSAAVVPTAEDVYTLTLTFYGNGDVVVGALTSRLAVVTGAFRETSVDPSPTEMPEWRKVKANVVIPYDAGWNKDTASATHGLLVIAKAGGITQNNALSNGSGYFGWKIRPSDWGYGTFDLALTFPGTATNQWDGTLARTADGMVIRLN